MTNSVELQLLASGLQNPTSGMLAKSTFVMAKSAVPVVLAPNGTVATNGVVTLGTALPLIYTSAWVRLPAGAVVGGSAGLYYVVFSSTTVGQVYTNFVNPASAFTPSIPATIVAAVGSNAGYTQATTELTLVNVAVAANQIGADGVVQVTALQSNNGTAGLKTLQGKLGSGVFLTAAVTTSVSIEVVKRIANRGAANVQLVTASPLLGTVSAVPPTLLAINTAAASSIVLTGTIAVATDYLVIESFAVEVQPS